MADEKKKDASGDSGASQVQETVDAEEKVGFRPADAEPVDPTPNENYTVAGVTSGKPTPETDEKARAKARERLGRR